MCRVPCVDVIVSCFWVGLLSHVVCVLVVHGFLRFGVAWRCLALRCFAFIVLARLGSVATGLVWVLYGVVRFCSVVLGFVC